MADKRDLRRPVAEEPVEREAPDRIVCRLPQRAIHGDRQQLNDKTGSRRTMIQKLRIGCRLARLAAPARNDAGMAAVEFSLILPLLVLLWIGGVEVTQALSVDRRLNN